MSHSWIISEKTRVPSRKEHSVIRPRLEFKLQQSFYHVLTLITAPAGYGKTTLASEWITRNHTCAAWVSLSEGDDAYFWHYLVYAIDTILPGFAKTLQPVLDSYHSDSLELAISHMVQELSQHHTPFVLVLDDYHCIKETRIHDGVRFLLMHLPKTAHLIIIGRYPPPFPYARLRTLGHVCEIDMNDLRFSSDETAELLDRSIKRPLPSDEISLLCAKTEGWAAGLKMASLYLHNQEDYSQCIREFTGTHRFIMDYLLDELWNQQPEHIRNFLLHTSILDRFCASLCCAVTENDASYELLMRLESTNLFIVPLDQNRTWFRYHHLFAELLRELLHQYITPDQLIVAHQRAYIWYAEKQLFKEAIPHALAAKDHEQVLTFMEHLLAGSDKTVQTLALQDWWQPFDVRLIMYRPKVFMYLVSTWVLFGRTNQAIRLLNDAENLMTTNHQQGTDDVFQTLKKSIAVMRGVINISLDYSCLLDHIDDVVTLMKWSGKQTDFLNRGEASLIRGHIGFGGRIKKSFELYSKLNSDSQRAKFFYDNLDGHGHVVIADIYYERNELKLSRDQLMKGMHYIEGSENPAILVPAYYLKAKLELAYGNNEDAITILHEAKHHIQLLEAPRWQSILEAAMVRIQLKSGNSEEGTIWVQRRLLRVTTKPTLANEFENITFARVLISQEKLKEASNWLMQLLQLAKKGGRYASVVEILLLLAHCRHKSGDSEQAIRLFEEALIMAEAEELIRSFLDEGPDIAGLLNHWLQTSSGSDRDGEMDQRHIQYGKNLLKLYDLKRVNPQPTVAQSSTNATALLTNRELEILNRINSGATNEEIARELFLSVGTVKRYAHHLYQKLEVRNRVEAVSKAKQLGILSKL